MSSRETGRPCVWVANPGPIIREFLGAWRLLQAMVLLDEHIVTTQARAVTFCDVADQLNSQWHQMRLYLQAMMFSTFKGPFEEDIDESRAYYRCG